MASEGNVESYKAKMDESISLHQFLVPHLDFFFRLLGLDSLVEFKLKIHLNFRL